MMDGLGTFIRMRRERFGWTQTRLAEEVGVRPAYISQIESGRTQLPTADLRRRLAAALGARHVDLLVAAGELTEDEIASIPRRWPTEDELKNQLHELIEQMSPVAARWVRPVIQAYVDDLGMQLAPETPPQSLPESPRPELSAEPRGR